MRNVFVVKDLARGKRAGRGLGAIELNRLLVLDFVRGLCSNKASIKPCRPHKA